MNKREWIKKLKAHNGKPMTLSPAELNELVLRLGSTIKDQKRPETKVFGLNKRGLNAGAIASVVFSYMENYERVNKLEQELKELRHPDYLVDTLKNLPEDIREEREDELRERLADEINYLEKKIERLRPISTKKRSDAIDMAIEWFKDRGIKFKSVALKKKHFENELNFIKEKYDLPRLQLKEWREI